LPVAGTLLAGLLIFSACSRLPLSHAAWRRFLFNPTGFFGFPIVTQSRRIYNLSIYFRTFYILPPLTSFDMEEYLISLRED
jgi:hypothetical protein